MMFAIMNCYGYICVYGRSRRSRCDNQCHTGCACDRGRGFRERGHLTAKLKRVPFLSRTSLKGGEIIKMSIQKQKNKNSAKILKVGDWAVIITGGTSIYNPTSGQKIEEGSIVQITQVKEFEDGLYFGFQDIHKEVFFSLIPRHNLIHLKAKLIKNFIWLLIAGFCTAYVTSTLKLGVSIWLLIMLYVACLLVAKDPLFFIELMSFAYKRIKQRRDRNVTPFL